jgi:hypothetical protein
MFVGVLLLAAPAAAQAPATTVQGVTVTAPENRPADISRLYRFVESVARPTLSGHYARWSSRDRLCPKVLGGDSLAPLFHERLATQARALGLTVDQANCTPDVFVIMTSEPVAVLTTLKQKRPAIFGDYMAPALEAMIATPAPVRIWQVTAVAPGAGDPINSTTDMPSNTQFDHQSHSHISTTTKDEIRNVLLVVDVNSAKGVTLGALADYLTMAALAQIDPKADMGGAQTILNLFRRRDADLTGPESLTSWDRAFLKSLYETRPDMLAVNERAAMAQIMSQVLQAPVTATQAVR